RARVPGAIKRDTAVRPREGRVGRAGVDRQDGDQAGSDQRRQQAKLAHDATPQSERKTAGWSLTIRVMWVPLASIVYRSLQQLSRYLRSAPRTIFLPSGEYRAKPSWCLVGRCVICFCPVPSAFITQMLVPNWQQRSLKMM